MNFKNLFKNKIFIIALILVVLIIISASLTQVSNIFFMITCFLACALCVLVGTKFVLDIKRIKNSTQEELLPLTQMQREQINKSKKMKKASLIIRAVVFYIFGILFFVLAF